MFLVLAAAMAFADPGVYSGRGSQIHVSPPRLETAIVVDGVLDESAWQQAARLTDFSQDAPVDGRPADEATDVLVLYTPTAIYFGVKAHAAAGAVHATLANRDKIDSDDSIHIFLNRFNDDSRRRWCSASTRSNQADGALVEGSNIWRRRVLHRIAERTRGHRSHARLRVPLEGRVTDEGYEVEIEIPFKTLRFPPDRVQRWGINVVRRVQSSGHEDMLDAGAAREKFVSVAVGNPRWVLRISAAASSSDLNPVVTAKADGTASPDRWTTARAGRKLVATCGGA